MSMAPISDIKYFTLTISLHRVGEAYFVELTHSDPSSQAQVAPVRAGATFDLDQLSELSAQLAAYGEALTAQVFANSSIVERFVQVQTAAQASHSALRVLIRVDVSAQELQSLRWELLQHPRSGAMLSTSEQVLLSRFMVSRDWQPVKLRARTELRALVAVAAPNPGGLDKLQLAPVDYEGEVGRARQVLHDVELETRGGPGSPLTLDTLITALRSGFDVLYLVCHGKYGRRGTPALILQDRAGEARPVLAEDFAVSVAELQRKPRLVVLASCQSAGTGELTDAKGRTSAQASLAGRLADAGVPGVIAMQGYISMATIEEMMPVFFRELLRDGQIDRALAVARAAVRSNPDAWMPALYTRLNLGRLWYTPGFAGDKAKDVWKRLRMPVAKGKVVPIIGPRLLEAVHGSSHDTAMRIATSHQYPLAKYEFDDLPRVSSYLGVKESRYNVIQTYQEQLTQSLLEQHGEWLPPAEVKKRRLGRLLGLVGDRLREREDDPHRILAELPASIYVTVNFDPLLERALKANERPPQRQSTRWRYRKAPVSQSEQAVEEPTAKSPLVYHVFGAFGPDCEDSLVLTEDDYFDYLQATTAAKLIPSSVVAALVDNSLLFLGFRLTDWHFRVLFRVMMNLPGRERLKNYCHVAVQIDPDMQTMHDVQSAKVYLSEYFGKEANIDIFWGSSEEFLAALRRELANTELSVDDEPDEDEDDEWDF
ncbi:MAG: CHAT domain-containing protein [Myxococcota bacterium]